LYPLEKVKTHPSTNRLIHIAWSVKLLHLSAYFLLGYTKWVYSDVVLNQQARVVHGGGMADCLPGGPVAGKPMAVQDAGAYGGLPCSTQHCIGLSLGLHIVSAPVPS
jgi:hypothetical protein